MADPPYDPYKIAKKWVQGHPWFSEFRPVQPQDNDAWLSKRWRLTIYECFDPTKQLVLSDVHLAYIYNSYNAAFKAKSVTAYLDDDSVVVEDPNHPVSNLLNKDDKIYYRSPVIPTPDNPLHIEFRFHGVTAFKELGFTSPDGPVIGVPDIEPYTPGKYSYQFWAGVLRKSGRTIWEDFYRVKDWRTHKYRYQYDEYGRLYDEPPGVIK